MKPPKFALLGDSIFIALVRPGATTLPLARTVLKTKVGKPHFGNDRPWLGKTKGRS